MDTITPMALFNDLPRSGGQETHDDSLDAFSFDSGVPESMYSTDYISSVNIDYDNGYAPLPEEPEEQTATEPSPEPSAPDQLQFPSEFDDSINDEEFILAGNGATMSVEHDIHGDDPDLFQDISGYNPYTKIAENTDVSDPEFVFSETESLETLIGAPSGSALPEIMFPGDDTVDSPDDEELKTISENAGLGGDSAAAFDKLVSDVDPEYDDNKMDMLISGIF